MNILGIPYGTADFIDSFWNDILCDILVSGFFATSCLFTMLKKVNTCWSIKITH